jgi:hypothetical protein
VSAIARGEKVIPWDCVRRLAESPSLVAIGAHFPAGELPQGRIGVGWVQLSDLRGGAAAAEPALVLEDVTALHRNQD